MEYLVTMTTQVPDGTTDEVVQEVRAREAARSRVLACPGAPPPSLAPSPSTRRMAHPGAVRRRQ